MTVLTTMIGLLPMLWSDRRRRRRDEADRRADGRRPRHLVPPRADRLPGDLRPVEPIDESALRRTLARTLVSVARLADGHHAGEPNTGAAAVLGMIGDHPSMLAALHRAEQVAASRVTVLISGETGTGKGLLAEIIHRMSNRSQGPFVELPCVTVSPSRCSIPSSSATRRGPSPAPWRGGRAAS
jgi:transcriptional regulator of acetoin/glycerol metabolism